MQRLDRVRREPGEGGWKDRQQSKRRDISKEERGERALQSDERLSQCLNVVLPQAALKCIPPPHKNREGRIREAVEESAPPCSIHVCLMISWHAASTDVRPPAPPSMLRGADDHRRS